jgi:hypothetical protein
MKKKLIAGLTTLLLVSGMAQASVIYYDVAPDKTSTPANNGNNAVGFHAYFENIGLTGSSSIYFSYGHAGESEMPLLYGGAYWLMDSGKAAMLNAGTEIGAGNGFGSTVELLEVNGSGPWDGGGDGYVGFRKGGSGFYNYGYLHFNYDDANNSLTLLDMASETTVNKSIFAGAGASTVPVPSTLWLLGLGVAGLIGLRRNKKA